MQKHSLILTIGSNLAEGESIVKQAATELSKSSLGIKCSSALRNPAVGMPDGCNDYYNMLVFMDTSADIEVMHETAKHIEQQLGNTKQLRSQGIVTVDIDIVVYDNNILKPNDVTRDYYKTLYKEIATLQ